MAAHTFCSPSLLCSQLQDVRLSREVTESLGAFFQFKRRCRYYTGYCDNGQPITLSSKPFEASCSEPNVCNTLAPVIALRWQLQLWRDLTGLVLRTRLGRRENGTNG